MKTVGADLYVCPKIPFRTNTTAMRHLVLVPINEMNGAVEKVPPSHEWLILPQIVDIFLCPPYGTVLHKPNRYVSQYYGLHKFDE